MFRRNSQHDTLPSTSFGTGQTRSNSFSFGGSSGSLDGSGRSIKMDAPVVKAWKKASGYTRYTYYFLGTTLFLAIYGFRSMMYWNSSIWLICHQQECTLQITPPGRKTITVVFPRTQLKGAQAIKTDKDGLYIQDDTDKYEPPERKKKKKKYKNQKPNWHSRGPDSMGRYRTYEVHFLRESPERKPRNVEDNDFSTVKEFLRTTVDGYYALHFRHFSLSQSRTRSRSNVNKVTSYLNRRRQKLIIKESTNLPWYSILCFVMGLVGTLMVMLIGQFYDEAPRRQGGPGARRSRNTVSSRRGSSGLRTPSKQPWGTPYRKY